MILSAYEQRNFQYESIQKGVIIPWSRESIERRISLDEKLHAILPSIFSIRSPKGRVIWTLYRRLKAIRDRIIHCKREDRVSGGPKQRTLWSDLMGPDIPNVAKDAKEVIGYYEAQSGQANRWFAKCPW